MKLVSKPILIGMAMGVVCNLTLLFLVVMSALGVYETSLIARLVFPYGAVINFSSDRDILILAALFLQYPLYGALFGIPWTHKKYRTLTLIVLIIVIGSCHVAAVKAANEADARWVESLPVEQALNSGRNRTSAWSGLAITVLLFAVIWASRSSAALAAIERKSDDT